MRLFTSATLSTIIALAALFSCPSFYLSSPFTNDDDSGIPDSDVDLIHVALNLEYFAAEFFLYGAFGNGLNKYAPDLTFGGPSPIGAQRAKLDPLVKDIIEQFAWQEVGHLRLINSLVRQFPRPLLNLSSETFAKTINNALGATLSPPFDPYANGLNFLIASYIIPYVGLTGYIGLTGYVGTRTPLQSEISKRIVASLLAVASGQDAVIRTLLYQRRFEEVSPYGITVANFTQQISELRNKLGGVGRKDEGLIVSKDLGAEGQTTGDVLAGDLHSVGYWRTPVEIFRIIYGSGNEHTPRGFFPKGANGRIGRSYIDMD